MEVAGPVQVADLASLVEVESLVWWRSKVSWTSKALGSRKLMEVEGSGGRSLDITIISLGQDDRFKAITAP
jgi:hypothetical protein